MFTLSSELGLDVLKHIVILVEMLQRPYSVYEITTNGKSVLSDGPIMLPVPESIREEERLEEEKRQKTLAELKNKGVDLEQIPQEELDAGDGEAISALKRWYSYVDSLAARGRDESVNEMDDLKQVSLCDFVYL